MTMVTIYQANNPETLPVSLATPEIVLETELPDRLQHTTGITYEGDDRDGHYTKINQPLTVNGNISSSNLTTMNADLQTIMNTLTNISYVPALQLTAITGDLSVNTLNGFSIGPMGEFSVAEYSPFLVATNVDGVTEIGKILDFHNTTGAGEDYLTRLSCVGSNTLEITGTGSMRMTRIDVSAGMAQRSGNTLLRFMKTDNATNMLSLNNDTNEATFLGNIVAPSLNGNKIGASNEGFGYTADAPYIPVCKANGITEVGNRIDFHLNDATFRDYSVALDNTAANQLSIKGMTTDTYGNLELGGLLMRPSSTVSCRLIANTASNMLWFNGAGVNTWVCDATGSVERWSTTRDKAVAADTRATAVTYTAGTPSNTTIAGDLTVTGSIHGTLAGSQTITHKTKYIGTLTLGCFVESTGEIYREPPKVGTTSIWNEPTEEGQTGYYTETQTVSSLSPYENCVSVVRQATSVSNNIIGVCTEIIDHEYCKLATHGDCLVKCESATYTLGDILVPSTGGLAKKGTNLEIIDALTHMVPRLKITSLETDLIDPQTVCAFISL